MKFFLLFAHIVTIFVLGACTGHVLHNIMGFPEYIYIPASFLVGVAYGSLVANNIKNM